jgi:transposase
VVDVPPKLSARARVFATGQGRKTDVTDAHSVALVATRMSGLRKVADDQQLAVLRILADRRRSLGEDHTRMISQLHRLLLELIPGGAQVNLSAAQARALLARVRPRDAAGKARKRVAAELISGLERTYRRKKTADKELRELLSATGSTLTQLHGIGPSGAARLLVEVGDITRFPRQGSFRLVERHRSHRCLLRRARPAPALPRRQPADQPCAPHHGRRPAPQPDRAAGLLRPQSRSGKDTDGSHASAETAAVRHRLPPDGRRRRCSGTA